jgi:hypothetical protein
VVRLNLPIIIQVDDSNNMRKTVTTLVAVLVSIGAATESSAQLLAMYESKADDFIKTILEHYAGIDSCPDEFDPSFFLEDKDVRTENYSYRRERDVLTPGGENHVQQWGFSGVTVSAFTYFSDYGPSTWLSRLELSEASVELDGNLKVGDSIDEFTKVLELSKSMKAARRISSSRANVTFQVNDKGNVTRVILECVAD